MRHLSFIVILMLIFTGCSGELTENQKQSEDIRTNDKFVANQQNSTTDENTNAIGSIGIEAEFGENEKITEGFWSLYVSRNIDLYLDYDTYLGGYKFYDDGSMVQQDTLPLYQQRKQNWGTDVSGSSITISPGNKFTITAQFDNEQNCYEVSGLSSGEKGKLCHEKVLNGANTQNSLGYIGESATYGTYKRFNPNVAGSWEFYPIDNSIASLQAIKTLKLNASGGVEGDATLNWGVSEDGKVLNIGNNSYLIFKYLSDTCVHTLEYTNNVVTNEVKLCKI